MNTLISSKTSRTVLLVLLGLIFLSHLPFINADPDRNMSVGRGPFTDEGLNISQVRNWVNQGELSLSECDNLLKMPLLGFPMALTFEIFGTSHAIARLHVLALLFLSLLWMSFDKKNTGWLTVFLPVSMLFYQVHQSSHFSMAEMLSCASIVLSIHFLSRSTDMELDQKLRDRQAVLSAAFISLAFFIKIQFIFMIPLLPIVLLVLRIRGNYFSRKMILRLGFLVTGTLLLFLLIYLFAWYLPNREAYDIMMAGQSGQLSVSGKSAEHLVFNLKYFFLKGWIRWFVYVFIILLLTGFLLLKKSDSRRFPVLFIGSLTWFALEFHKLIMPYLPERYQISLLVSMGLVSSLVINELFAVEFTKGKALTRLLGASALIIILSLNVYNYADALNNRTFAIREANHLLSRSLGANDVVLGAWAPTLTWDAGSRAIPVWNNFLNYQDPIRKFHPKAIIAESDEQDSEQAWKSQGINLAEIADSSRSFRIGKWDVVVYWMK